MICCAVRECAILRSVHAQYDTRSSSSFSIEETRSGESNCNLTSSVVSLFVYALLTPEHSKFMCVCLIYT